MAQAEATEAPAMSLAELVRHRQDETGWSYNDIARRGGLSKAKVGQIARTTQPHMPRADTLRKLADGLELPLHVIQRAAMISAGIDLSHDGGRDQRLALINGHLAPLDDDDLLVVEAMLSALRLVRTGDTTKSTPTEK